MVLSQIELRSSTAPTTLTSPEEKRNKTNKKSNIITRYVEGDSSNEEDTNVIVEIEHDDADAIEDVELDGVSEDDEDDDDMSNESEDDEEGMHNSFIDDEAEEEYSDEENEDDSE